MTNNEIIDLLNEMHDAHPEALINKMDEMNKGSMCLLLFLDTNKDKKIISNDIAKALNMSNCRVSKLIVKLMLLMLVEKKKNKDDARQSYIRLTKKGIQRVEKFKSSFLDSFQDVVEDVGVDNIKEYIKIAKMIKESSIKYSL